MAGRAPGDVEWAPSHSTRGAWPGAPEPQRCRVGCRVGLASRGGGTWQVWARPGWQGWAWARARVAGRTASIAPSWVTFMGHIRGSALLGPQKVTHENGSLFSLGFSAPSPIAPSWVTLWVTYGPGWVESGRQNTRRSRVGSLPLDRTPGWATPGWATPGTPLGGLAPQHIQAWVGYSWVGYSWHTPGWFGAPAHPGLGGLLLGG